MSAFREALKALQGDERLVHHLQRAEQGRPMDLPTAMPFLLRLGVVGCMGFAELIDRLPAPAIQPDPRDEAAPTKPAAKAPRKRTRK